MSGHKIICLQLDDRDVAPLAWTNQTLSVKQLRRFIKPHKKYKDVEYGCVIDW